MKKRTNRYCSLPRDKSRYGSYRFIIELASERFNCGSYVAIEELERVPTQEEKDEIERAVRLSADILWTALGYLKLGKEKLRISRR